MVLRGVLQTGLLLSVFSASLSLAGTGEPPHALVRLKQGELRGVVAANGTATFQAIPYAAPPVGPLRWHSPEAPAAWSGIRDATKAPPACMQPNMGWNAAAARAASEDCLYLNVVTPRHRRGQRLPVFFWIHGGANYGGSGTVFVRNTLTEHGVVVVTINYRLGILGFLSLPQLTRESAHHASGNYGLQDQIAALRWVHDNIAAFGGDPGNITVAGQSAGAGDIGLLMASPLTSGLFEHAISESGGPIGPGGITPNLSAGERTGESFAQAAGASGEDVLAKLRAMPAERIVAIGMRMSSPGPLGMPQGIAPAPIVDGYVLTEQPAQAFRTGDIQHVPYMIGNQVQELPYVPAKGAPPLRAIVERAFGAHAQQALEAYGLDRDHPPAPDPVLGPVGTQVMTDIDFRCPALTTATWIARNGGSVWEYQFEQPIPGMKATMHTSELPYVFGWAQPSENGGIFPAKYTAQDGALSEHVQEYWTNFAKSGDPNGAGLPAWPKVAPHQSNLMLFANKAIVASTSRRTAICGAFAAEIEDKLR